MDMTYSRVAMKKGSASKPMPISDAPSQVLNALGNLHSAPLMPDAAPRSSSATRPIIIDWERGLAMFMSRALMLYTSPARA